MPPVQPASGDCPEDDFEDLPVNVEHSIAITDSDSEVEENAGHEGYELLSQDPYNCLNESDSDEDDSNFVGENGIEQNVYDVQTLLLPAPSNEMMSEFPEDNKEDTHMDEGHIEKIKDLMKGIQLPPSNLPSWASAVPEEEWKAQLLSQMGARRLREREPSVTIASSPSGPHSAVFVGN